MCYRIFVREVLQVLQDFISQWSWLNHYLFLMWSFCHSQKLFHIKEIFSIDFFYCVEKVQKDHIMYASSVSKTHIYLATWLIQSISMLVSPPNTDKRCQKSETTIKTSSRDLLSFQISCIYVLPSCKFCFSVNVSSFFPLKTTDNLFEKTTHTLLYCIWLLSHKQKRTG